jgi:hypothetical protein
VERHAVTYAVLTAAMAVDSVGDALATGARPRVAAHPRPRRHGLRRPGAGGGRGAVACVLTPLEPTAIPGPRSTTRHSRWSRCWRSTSATAPTACSTRRGRRSTRGSPTSRHESHRAEPAARTRSLRGAAVERLPKDRRYGHGSLRRTQENFRRRRALSLDHQRPLPLWSARRSRARRRGPRPDVLRRARLMAGRGPAATEPNRPEHHRQPVDA